MKPVLIDTHAHIYLDQFTEDRNQVIERARAVGVEKILLPNIDCESIASLHQLEIDYPDYCVAMMGLHPCSVDQTYEQALGTIKEWLDQRKYIALGEIGLDYYWDQSTIPLQKEAFITQVNWAHEKNLPIVIHSRDSIDDILDILESLALPGLTGVFHCFTGDHVQAKRIQDLSFHMGIGGVLTFKNSKIDVTVKDIPLNWLIMETDAPYLTPHPHRGKRNESSYVSLVAEKLADVKNLSLEEVARKTTENAQNLFGI